jgi:hypothetical protein
MLDDGFEDFLTRNLSEAEKKADLKAQWDQ